MDELTIESFASELAQAAKPEQPAKADSGPEVDADAQAGDSTLSADEQQAAEGEGESQEPEADAEQSEQPEADSDQASEEPVHEWKTANGETFKVTQSELRAGYLRQQDYTQKTQALAENARQSQAQFQQQQHVLAAIASDVGEIQSLQAQLKAFDGIDWAAEDIRDPAMADRARLRLVTLRQQLTDAQAKAGAKAQQITQAQAEQHEAAVKAAEAKLVSAIPDITREEIVKVFDRLAKLGATQTELHFARGMPWLVEAAVYAHRFMELKAKTPAAQAKLAKAPAKAIAPRQAVPSSKTEATLKAVNSRRAFSTNEFAQLLASAAR